MSPAPIRLLPLSLSLCAMSALAGVPPASAEELVSQSPTVVQRPALAAIRDPAPLDGAAPAAAPDRYFGSFSFDGGDTEAVALRSTVDAMVDDFSVFLRGLARRRLERSVQVPERIEIAASEGGIHLQVIGSPDFPTDARFEDGVLVLRQSSFEGRRETRFALSEDGEHLTMHVVTRSALLPNELDYTLSFARSRDGLAKSTSLSEEGSL